MRAVISKAMRSQVELGISPAAIPNGSKGHCMSVRPLPAPLPILLDISLDWLLHGSQQPDWLQPDQLSGYRDRFLFRCSRQRPERVGGLLIILVERDAEVPPVRGFVTYSTRNPMDLRGML